MRGLRAATPRPSGPAHVVGRLQPAVVGDVLSQRLAAVDVLAVHSVAAVLLRHAGRAVLEGLQRGVLPPGPQVAFLVVLTACGTEPWGSDPKLAAGFPKPSAMGVRGLGFVCSGGTVSQRPCSVFIPLQSPLLSPVTTDSPMAPARPHWLR